MKIALDVDDVLANFCQHAADFFGKPLVKQDYWCTKTMDKCYGTNWFSKIIPVKEFWETIPVLSPASDIDFEVAAYISSFPAEMYDVRVSWLKKNGYPNAPLIISNDKLLTCLDYNIEVLVDDRPETITNLLGSPVIGLHFIAPYAGFSPVDNHITSLKQVKPFINEFRKNTVIHEQGRN